MSSIADQVILYVKQTTRGLVSLKKAQADEIINIVYSNKDTDLVPVEKYRYNGVVERYEPVQTLLIEKEQVQGVIEKVKGKAQYKGFYLFQIPTLQFEIHTINPNLF